MGESVFLGMDFGLEFCTTVITFVYSKKEKRFTYFEYPYCKKHKTLVSEVGWNEDHIYKRAEL